MQHAGLDDAQLGPRLARLLAANSPLPAREMVARGLAPLAGAEVWLALYQLWVRGGPTLAEHASRTAGELPPAAVMTALADPHLPPVVLDFMARRRIRSPETLRLVVHHPRVHDATLAALARCAPEAVCGAIAKNQRRWLACPAIAEQLVHNPCCDRATAHAVLELGAREAIAGLVELRRRVLAGAHLQDDPDEHARATAWMLRSSPQDAFSAQVGNLSFRPASDPRSEARPSAVAPTLRPGAAPRPGDDLSLRAGRRDAPPRTDLSLQPDQSDLSLQPGHDLSLQTAPTDLSLRPGLPAPSREPDPPLPAVPDLSLQPGPALPALADLSLRPGAPLPAPRADAPAPTPTSLHRIVLDDELDPDGLDLDELDLPIGDDWDDALGDVDVPAPRSAVPLPELELPPAALRPNRALARVPQQLELPTPSAPARPAARSPAPSTANYRDALARVLDPTTPLPLAMSLLHRLRAPDLRRIATTRRLAPALVAAARRRTGAA